MLILLRDIFQKKCSLELHWWEAFKALVQIRLYKVLKIINFDFVKIGLLGMGYPK